MNLLIELLLAVCLIASIVMLRKVRRKYLDKSIEVSNLSSQLNELRISNLDNIRKQGNCEVLARLVEQSPNAIMLMDANGDILSVNSGFSQMYEYNFDEFTAALGFNYRQTSFSSEVDQRLEMVRSSKRAYRYEALNITKSGREIWTQTALVPIVDDEGNVTHFVTIDTDINQRVVKSDLLVSQMEELYKRIDQLTVQFSRMENEFTSLFSSMSGFYDFVNQTNDILSFIKQISDETRILGLNASIEASRAGEYGRGFRVITNEIISISENTINSIKQIKSIVDSINKKQQELMYKQDNSEGRVVDFNQLISELKEEFETIEYAINEFKSIA